PSRLHDLLDGALSPEAEAALRAEMESDRDLAGRYARAEALHAFLSEPLDVDPPADLTVAILAAVRADSSRRFSLLRLPAWAENTLVLGGAAGVAGVVALVRMLGAGWAAPWIGRLTVGAAEAVEVAKAAVIGTQGSVQHMDWALRLLETLSAAGWKALGSSADLLAVCALVSLALATAAAWMLWPQARFARVKGGGGHAHLLA
ncbi:hypothetical protein K8I85_06395, partial [bacterium]|nr:hypothetical protein [bacterium]